MRKLGDRVACVLLDLTMPRMDGPSAMREIRRIRPDAKIVLCSGFDEQDAAQQCGGDAPAGILQKPYGLHDLQRELARVLLAPPRHQDESPR
jgi:CheY-like chemotaxis protein